jgi:uncharacterized protein (DUF302 family)
VSPPTAPGVVSVSSAFSVPETLRRLEEAVAARGMKVFARFDHSDEAERAGLRMRPAHVLVFGAPRGGTPLMVAAPLVALDLPLRALVWQEEGGAVWVSYHEPGDLGLRYSVPEDLIANIAGIGPLIAGAARR